ncbi:hypothetical protein [Paraburkholderia silvatlantica]|uniref:Uncharacterized protein n=1 Tax=Paraburkholderia silvatlantica TaxID=321895 RepID=A0ABR6FT00_9BURK|nr:hypothetical protein [Paraburkholderia silvatlantica]MBB2930148.1 hypothetical protein [Paraburkholderia silvatlantica]PVY22489.1 hypothetical protein C7411_13189 [Paraburkholderia silvatlantica]PXW28958.1 hypothetical protein C7413_13189 [Paraburkholderia silvatlantica]
MQELIRKIRRILGDGVVVGVIVPIALAVVPPYFKQEAAPTAGAVQVQRGFTYALFGAPTLINGSDAPQFGLTLNDKPVPLGHLEMRPYTLRNLSGRNLAKADFETPITIKATPGQRILYVGVNPAPGHAPVKVTLTGDTQAVVDPMLLNINEEVSINILLYRAAGVPLAENPYADDSGVLSWTADIKGADLSVVGAPHVEMPTTYPIRGIVLYTAHLGYGVIALVLVGFLLSGLQIKKFSATKSTQSFKTKEILWLAGRVTLAWITADTVVRMFDYQIVPLFTWRDNWSIIGAFIATMIFPLPPDLLGDSKQATSDPAAPTIER